MIDKVDFTKEGASVSEAVKEIDFTAILEKYVTLPLFTLGWSLMTRLFLVR